MEILTLSTAAAAGMVILALKLGVRRILGYEVFMDIIITALLMISLAGSATGMTIALTAGLMTSLTLSGLKQLIGYDRLEIGRDRIGKRTFSWTRHHGLLA